jgi:fatty acid-binding protein DegV
MDYLYNFVTAFGDNIEAVAIEHTTASDEADKLVERLGTVVASEKIVRSTVSPVLGTYGGPGAVAVTVLEAVSK